MTVRGIARCSCSHWERFQAKDECEALKIRRLRAAYPCMDCQVKQLLAAMPRQRLAPIPDAT